jgi:hypothetical protein
MTTQRPQPFPQIKQWTPRTLQQVLKLVEQGVACDMLSACGLGPEMRQAFMQDLRDEIAQRASNEQQVAQAR